jgi:hypothetical protein
MLAAGGESKYNRQVMIKRMVFVILVIGLGFLFFLQKQHEKRAAIEAKRRAEAASKQVAHTGASDKTNAQNTKEARKPLGSPTAKPQPTSMLPKPTPMLPKPTPVLSRTP